MVIMNYHLNVINYNGCPLRYVTGTEAFVQKELLFVVDDLIRLAGIEGMTKQLLLTVLKSRFKFPNRFKTRELRLRPLDGYEERPKRHVLTNKAGAYYILSGAKINPEFDQGYNDHTKRLLTWFEENFKLNEYDRREYESLKNSIVTPIDDIVGTDYINFIWTKKGIFY